MTADSNSNGKWYGEGLRFECTQCGDCCSGAPGFVYVSEEEIEKIAAFMGRPGEGLPRTHVRLVGRQYSLTEDRKSGDCVFLRTEKNGRRTCGIYPVRPLQCRTWPFWTSNLESSEDWASAAASCPGMNKGRSHDFVQIEVRRTATSWEDLSR
ncbi:MAG: YkgJ family cysteine cluster protein [Phycisphaerales bacterium]|nr:YkgJ family cysteine cluster protein [Phycisphaerales bacterium]